MDEMQKLQQEQTFLEGESLVEYMITHDSLSSSTHTRTHTHTKVSPVDLRSVSTAPSSGRLPVVQQS